jgi:hypothetical protein
MSTAPEPSPVVGVASVEDAIDLVTRWYVDFPGIGTVDLDTPELPSNDREVLEVATEGMFAEPSILDTITSVTLALRQYEGAGGSTPPVASEVAIGVVEESVNGAKSAVDAPVPLPIREGHRTRPCCSPQKQSHPRPLLRWSAWRRALSHPLPRRRFSCRASRCGLSRARCP